MSAGEPARPPGDAWVAAVHATAHDHEPLGTAVVIDERRLLTCAHVVTDASRAAVTGLWVSFQPGGCPRRRVATVRLADDWHPVRDVAVLVLDDPVPAGVEAAPLRCPAPGDLVADSWWAFGFPDRDPFGDSADGSVGTGLAYGWIRLDTGSRYLVRPGFSGGGLWSAQYEAVVAIVGQAHGNGDGRAITLHQADLCLPAEKLRLLTEWSVDAAGEVAMAAWGLELAAPPAHDGPDYGVSRGVPADPGGSPADWGWLPADQERELPWTLDRDPEAVRHWRPRARGVSVDSERGFRFRGRTAALTTITRWLDRATPDRRVLVVTGSPGVGKSAVLGRVVTTADPQIRATLPTDDRDLRATIGSVGCAVHAKAKTALEVAAEIARAASARLPEHLADLAPYLREALEQRGSRRFNVIIDALDEAASPKQAREIISKIIVPIAETCADAGAQVVVGTRRGDDAGSLLAPFGGVVNAVDLDETEYFEEADLVAYTLASLQLSGSERSGSPYARTAVALPVAQRIAELADRNFLVAGLVARGHGLHDERAVEPADLTFDASVDAALADYLDRLDQVGALTARQALTALAYADAPGLPAVLWQAAIEGLYGVTVQASALARFARYSAASYIIESSDSSEEGDGPVFRLFHQALNDTLLRARASGTEDERTLTEAFTAYGRRTGWHRAPQYLLHSLPGHAATADLIDDLLTDDDYLLEADLRRLMLAAAHPRSEAGQRRLRLLGLTPQATSAGSGARAALFSVTEVLDALDSDFAARRPDAPYQALWARALPRGARTVLEGHQDWVAAICPVLIDSQELLATGSFDWTVRIWDPATAIQITVLEGHQGPVYAVCTVTIGDRELLATASSDQTIRIWDPATATQITVLEGHQGPVYAVCTVTIGDRELLATASSDQTIRIWDPATATQITILEGHQGPVYAVCPVTVAGQTLLATASDDRGVWIWDLATATQIAILEGHDGLVNAVCTVTIGDRELLATASTDRTVRIWDPATATQIAILEGHDGLVNAVCTVTIGDRELLATASTDRTVRIWDPATATQIAILEGHQDVVNAVCPVTVAGQTLLATASDDRGVWIWDLATATQTTILEGRHGLVNAVCPVTISDRELLATASTDRTVRIWDPATATQTTILKGHHGTVNAICPVTTGDRELLATASTDQTIRIWDPATATQTTILEGHHGPVNAVCPVTVAGQTLLATASTDRTVRIWDPATATQTTILKGHHGPVNAICPVTTGDRELLATASDHTIRIWNPATATQTTILEGHQGSVYAICPVTIAGQTLLATASDDQTVRIWDPATATQTTILEGHHGPVYAICPVTIAGQTLLATASDDQTVRIWNPATNWCLLTVPVHHSATALAWVDGGLAIGLDAGVLMIDLSADYLAAQLRGG